MSTIWFTSDTHFGHQAIIKHSNRPFADVEEMDEHMIQKWNEVVSPNDQVYHLGDVGLGSDKRTLECVSRLKGHKHLIAGNHDSVHPSSRRYHGHYRSWMDKGHFESITTFAKKKIAGRDVLLSHFPYAGDHTETDRMSQYRLRNEGLFLLHGHVHEKWILQEAQYNVGVDVHEFMPISLDHVAQMVRLHYQLIQALDENELDKTIDPSVHWDTSPGGRTLGYA